jgi:hypothetical protein
LPSFPDQLDVSIDRGTAQYAVRSQVAAQGKEEVLSGQVELPNDVYNGRLPAQFHYNCWIMVDEAPSFV